jgi:hypothetical protein
VYPSAPGKAYVRFYKHGAYQDIWCLFRSSNVIQWLLTTDGIVKETYLTSGGYAYQVLLSAGADGPNGRLCRASAVVRRGGAFAGGICEIDYVPGVNMTTGPLGTGYIIQVRLMSIGLATVMLASTNDPYDQMSDYIELHLEWDDTMTVEPVPHSSLDVEPSSGASDAWEFL